ncbi:MAG: 6-phospho-beta-glucosidase [Chloroflexota bacterium]
MKLTVIGGGGVRAPLFVASALRRAAALGLDEICLMDVDGPKLALTGALAQGVARKAGSPVRVTTTTNARQALDGASFVVTTIRVGGDEGRVLDERIALRHGVLGQETTGPGGFAMALRSIPAILGYARLRDELCPDAWMFNFTNPAGLVTQALHDAGFARAVGICDSANGAQEAIAARLGCAANDLRPEVFGLNHLSWTRRVTYQGEDVLPRLLADPEVLRETRLNIFEPALVRHLEMWLNEYLYYFYYAERAVAAISAEERTRGEEVLMLNRDLLAQLKQLDPARDLDAALAAYYRYERRRSSTYMHYAQQDAPTPEEADALFSATFLEVDPHEGEGYAGVALDIMAALTTGEPRYTALNMPNNGAIAGMAVDDVVEVSCVVNGDGVHTLPTGAIPDGPALLMQVIKRYERLTVRAVAERSRALAIDALMAHPLVLSYSRARALVDEYLAAHAPYVGEWA